MANYVEWVRAFCLGLPHTTEGIQWEHSLLFRIANKIYCGVNLEPGLSPSKVTFKCTPEKFAELVEIEGIIPAPYMARNHWVSLVSMEALPQAEIKRLIQTSYALVMEKLPRKVQAKLSVPPKKAKKRKMTATKTRRAS